MNEQRAELPRAATADLRALVRRAKLEDAERSSVIAELRGAELARLELLRDALAPVFAQVPPEAELFEHGLVPGEKPRLFVDMVAFVEMARDRRCYRFIQDTRSGTMVLAESEKLDAMTREIATYLARRLVEREKALSAPHFAESAAPPAAQPSSPAPAEPAAARRGAAGWQLFLTLILGIILGAALALAYKAGQFEELRHFRWW